VIKSFKCKETEKIWQGLRSIKFPLEVQVRALRKLRQIEASQCVGDLKMPPGNNLELLKGDRKGQMSIRVNQQWRICFVWEKGGVYDVEIVDYH
jgi:toxin HigB-1